MPVDHSGLETSGSKPIKVRFANHWFPFDLKWRQAV